LIFLPLNSRKFHLVGVNNLFILFQLRNVISLSADHIDFLLQILYMPLLKLVAITDKLFAILEIKWHAGPCCIFIWYCWNSLWILTINALKDIPNSNLKQIFNSIFNYVFIKSFQLPNQFCLLFKHFFPFQCIFLFLIFDYNIAWHILQTGNFKLLIQFLFFDLRTTTIYAILSNLTNMVLRGQGPSIFAILLFLESN